MSFAIERIDHVVLNCRDVDAVADWYVRVLGMRREVFAGGRVALRFGDQKLNLRPTGAPNWPTAAADSPGSVDLCFITTAPPDDVAVGLRKAGVTITEGPVPKTGALGPMTSYYCRDPEGNLVEIASYPRP
ncbi:catechol 2,3-dioxygenase-like lactoylglutathione lyase family enzyme [Mycolicibacterium sp. BK556]|uniref:VOC family protein n=1 Tax=unclassified Mycolicibacterium TaxID=2636767 RepID=UPI00161A513E|nr:MULTISPECIES: VOC family protein [unclassified Mycolicibacterium]MBB3603607.1 catechol 2,3-dioxygenase-like lactoylglutathione lyase family enzyme [Mycolicibacterium sp. BK556]MBB3633802.1 catechol 2,3-dioxygenase-like lactoylglutathione lyase family enzyme [Mycolicibacterium sp. BK607]